eukprot:TRINITY_DN12213_c0_g1_i3.p3 TRINITY_DN12213_c0_g1~~TRINITY_DN12213_c0_g1_i3.p3  ORF type:complete len:105 (+),score=10.63 TRINITY_DN12213_c0_g1_i3:130-444(+)
MIRRPPRSTHCISSAASDVYKRQILGRLLNYLLVPLYTYQFATSEYGVVTEMYAYVSLFAVILTYGMETAFFRYSQTEDDKGKVYGTSVLSLIITSAVFPCTLR